MAHKTKASIITEALLMKEQKYRDSDGELIVGLLQALGANLTPEQTEIIRTVNFESVTRQRRGLQDGGKGKYVASPAVAKQRKLKSMVVQQNAPTAKPEYLQHLAASQPEPLQFRVPVDWEAESHA